MEKREASRSASFIAAHRAMESFRNPEDRVCVDPFARRLLPAGFTVIGPSAIPEETALNIFRDFVPGFHEFFIARTRYIDDRLQALIDGGLEQLVILGAGYDSRAYRFDALKTHIKVFEVDHPATQRVKKEKLLEIFRVLPRHVTYIPVDFRDAELGACLFDHGYDRCLKTLFILEGVLMYVAPGAVDETLAFISANTAKGSAVIFDYTYPEVLAGTCDRKEARQWVGRPARTAATWSSGRSRWYRAPRGTP